MLISNPFASSLFWPTVYRTAGVLGAALLIMLVMMRFDRRRLVASVLFKRLLIWLFIALIFVPAVLSGPLIMAALVSLVVFQGLREYASLAQLPPAYRRALLAMGLLAAPTALISQAAFYALAPLLLILATLQPLFFRNQGQSFRHLAFAAFGWGYLAWLLGHLLLLYLYTADGPGVILAVGVATALSDVGAFTIGKRFGRHKLAPQLSPNKTWEGLLGNLIGALIGVGLMWFALPNTAWFGLLAPLPFVVALGAVWGDLLESSIKREFGVKDAGSWLPGFGGLLDRIDSLIIVAPLVFYLLQALG